MKTSHYYATRLDYGRKIYPEKPLSQQMHDAIFKEMTDTENNHNSKETVSTHYLPQNITNEL
jgi:hypothetical protein